MFDETLIDEVAKAVDGAKRLVVLTGAGASAGSGVPTFRDALEGLWSKYDPMELATPGAFERDAELVTKWYDERRLGVLGCEPNDGHYALVRLSEMKRERGEGFTAFDAECGSVASTGGE